MMSSVYLLQELKKIIIGIVKHCLHLFEYIKIWESAAVSVSVCILYTVYMDV